MRTKLSILFWIIQNRPQILQPNGDRTDILQKKSHYNKKAKRNDGYSHTHPKTENVDKEGVSHSTLSQDTHQPTYEEIKNIEDGKAL